MPVDRRQLLLGAAAIPIAHALPGIARATVGRSADDQALYDMVMELHDSLLPWQRQKVCLPADSPRRTLLHSSWFIRPDKIGDVMNPAQRELALRLFRELHSPDYIAEVERQVVEDALAPGVDGVSLAFCGEPGVGAGLGLVFAGRHVTRRWEETSAAPFSGTVLCGHASETFDEPPHHPGNVYWYQAVSANTLLQSLDAPERKLALVGGASVDEPDGLERPRSKRGLLFGDLDGDRFELARALIHDIVVRPFRPAHAARALEVIDARGGIAALKIHLFRKEDYGMDGIYDNFEIWGPGFHCNFRGAPHSHCWLDIKA